MEEGLPEASSVQGKKGRARRFVKKLFAKKDKVPQGVLFPRLQPLFFAHAASIESGDDPIAQAILEKYDWLGDAAVRALEGVKSGGSPISDLGKGYFGRTWKVTYGEVDYAMKISFHDLKDVPFGIGEGMIGAYLAAPNMRTNEQRDVAVPAYRARDPAKRDHDPFVHVADYYGMLALRADEGKRALDALVGAENGRWASVKEHVEASGGKLSDPKNSYALLQILEFFDGGNLEEFAIRAMGTDPGKTHVPDWGDGWEERHSALLHYLKLAFYEISLTLVRLRELGFSHGDLHVGNVLLRMVERELAMAIYKRGPDLYNLLDPTPGSAPPFPWKDPGLFPVFAMADLGLSVIGSFGRAAGKEVVAHQAQDLHKFASWVVYLVVAHGTPPLDTTLLGSLSNEQMWVEARAYTKALHATHAFLAALMKFLVLPDEAQRLFRGFGKFPTNVINVEYADDFFALTEYVALAKRYADLWTNTFSRSGAFPGMTPDVWTSRARLLNAARANELKKNKAALVDAVGNGNFGRYVFHDGTDWSLANDVFERQVAAVEQNVVATPHMLTMDGEETSGVAREFDLVQPDFVVGGKKFWAEQPSSVVARGNARTASPLLWDEDDDDDHEEEEEGKGKESLLF